MGVVIEICIKYPRGELECNPLACYTAVAPETGRALVSRWGWGSGVGVDVPARGLVAKYQIPQCRVNWIRLMLRSW
jgi:hypothetical protein